MTFAYPHVADRLFGRALAIEPLALRSIVEGPIGRRVLSGERFEGDEVKNANKTRRSRVSSIVAAESVRSGDGMSEYALTEDGVAILSVSGALSRRFDWLAAACGWTTYEGLGASLQAAIRDYRVRGILLDVDSPGGEAAGMLDMADQILAARDVKPIWSVANTYAASAAYAIGACGSRFFLPRLALVGSIGAVIVHVDQSAQDEARGLQYTAIFSGARKIDGFDHAPLDPGARDVFQARVDHCRQSFADLVGRQERISAAAAIVTEAAMYSDDAAVKAGLADAVSSFDDAIAEFTDFITPNPQSQMAANAQNRGTTAMKQKDQMLATSSPSAIVAAQNSAAIEVPAAPAAAATATTSAAPSKPAPGEKCETCGQMMPDDDEDDGDKPDPDAAASVYTVEMAIETMDLCAIAKLPASDAKAFVAAKTPISTVRANLAARAAAAADVLAVDATAAPAGAAEQNVAAAWDQVVTEQNAKLPQSSARR